MNLKVWKEIQVKMINQIHAWLSLVLARLIAIPNSCKLKQHVTVKTCSIKNYMGVDIITQR